MADTSITGYYQYLAVTTTTYYNLGYCVQPAVLDEDFLSKESEAFFLSSPFWIGNTCHVPV
eukprot:3798065-Rhodomonas_salina.1